MQNQTQEKSVPRPSRYGRPSVPPNLFTDQKRKRMSRTKRLALTAIFAIVSIGILFFPQQVTVKVMGKTVPAIIYSADAPFAGRVVKVLEAEGSLVRAGDVIAVLQSDSLNNQIAQQTKEVEILKAQMGQAKLEFQSQEIRRQRYRLYLEVGTIAETDLKNVENDLAKAQAEVSLLTHQLEKGESALTHLQTLKEMETIKAPADGVILSPLRDKIGMVLSTGEEILQLASNEMVLEFLVPENQAHRVVAGTAVKVRFMSEPFKTYAASVIKLDEKVDEQVERMWLVKNVIRVTVKLKQPISLSPGMQAQAVIHSQKTTNFVQKIATHFFL